MESMSANDLPPKLEKHWRAIQKEFGGVLIYIPVRDSVTATKAARNGEIFASFLKGERVVALADRHGLSRTRVYKILASFRERATAVQ